MRVVSWNMGMARQGHRRPGLHDQAWHYLLGLGPDLAFLQECLPPTWIRTEGTLVHGPFRQWGSALFSARFPLERFTLPSDSHLRALGSYLALGVVSLPDGTEAFVSSVHAVAREATATQVGNLDPASASRPSIGRPRINDVVFMGLRDLVRDRPFLVAGDWNTARLFDSTYPGTAGAEFFARAHENGWFECVWEKRRAEVQTWFRRGNRPYQLDHVFSDPALGQRLQEAWVATEAAQALRLSDHAPVIVDFEMPPISMSSMSTEQG
jgi:endonuclease/exonuclease/phosphatase (EEP) superfamily protein YafD